VIHLKHNLAASVGIAVCAILAVPTKNFAQDRPEKLTLKYEARPWTGGTPEDAVAAARSGATIPLSTYSIAPTKVKEKKPLTGTIVGTSPFATPLSGVTINAVVVPLIIGIGSSTFDPTAPNNCGVEAGNSALNSFNESPLVQPVPNLMFDGMNVGQTNGVQYIDGFMRAEFWNVTGGSAAYANPISYTTAAPTTITADSTNGITTGSGCTLLGVVSESFLSSQLATQLQNLTQSGAISTTKVVFFLMSNVVLSQATPPTPPGTSTCCIAGYHSAIGATPQFYAVMDYGTTGSGVKNTAVAAHEIGEFMNDPLGSNAVPAWGGIGQVAAGKCQGNLEVGDPLTGTTLVINMNSYDYYMQELAFFSWYFNSPTTASLGAGAKFSSNGTFGGPSKVCPPGGTY
jgi:hypothetical protein